MEETSSEEFISLRRIQQGCHSELCNRKDFPFKKQSKTLKAQANKAEYAMPDGTILNIWIKKGGKKLEYNPDVRFLTQSSGVPTSYGFNNGKLVLHPAPKDIQEIIIDYNSTKNVIDKEGEYSYTITVGSTLSMDEDVQHLYVDALVYRVVFEYMRKVSNPRLSETENLFKEKWQAFLNASRVVDSETYFVI
jgi:hypothetical protein